MYTAAIAAAYNHTFSILHIDFSLGCLGKAGSYWRAGFFKTYSSIPPSPSAVLLLFTSISLTADISLGVK